MGQSKIDKYNKYLLLKKEKNNFFLDLNYPPVVPSLPKSKN